MATQRSYPCKIPDCSEAAWARKMCRRHYDQWRYSGGAVKPRDPEQRFWSFVNKKGPWCKHLKSRCWVWTGAKEKQGYGQFRPGRSQPNVPAARWVIEFYEGPIPNGFEPDHLCFTTSCVRREHLDVVTALENQRRKNPNRKKPPRRTRCFKGHELTSANTIIKIVNGREKHLCRLCHNATTLRYRHRKGVSKTYRIPA